MRQHVVHLPGGRFGIRTVPDGQPRPTGLVLVNSGIVHRIGANRMTVHLARRAAEHRLVSIRFDMSGIGDAPDRVDGLGWEAASPLEICEVIDVLRERDGVRDVVLYGNCGGAAKSFWAARRDERVTGLLVTNPPPPPDDPLYGERVEDYAHGRFVTAEYRGDVVDGLSALLERRVRMLFVYAEGDVGESYFWHRLAPELAPARADGRLRVDRVTSTNHTMATRGARGAFLDLATQWLTEHFGAERA